MRRTVTWEPVAENQLINLWIQAPDQQDVADASNRIEQALKRDAKRKGQPLGRFRTYRDDPLAVLYLVLPDDCMVKIVQVKRVT